METQGSQQAPWVAPQSPPPTAPYVRVLRVRPGAPVVVVFLSSRPYCLWTHWMGNREVACVGARGNCEGCLVAKARRWGGWLAAYLDPPGKQVAIEVTPGAAQYCAADHFRDVNLSFRGWRARLTRMGPIARSPLKLEMRPPPESGWLGPQPFDVEAFVARLYLVEAGQVWRAGQTPHTGD